MCFQGSCGVTKHTLSVIPVLDTLAGDGEEHIFNMFNHLSNEPIFEFNCLVDFLTKQFQALKLVNVIDKRATGLQLKPPNLLPIE